MWPGNPWAQRVGRLRFLISPADPGGLRLFAALRATLAGVLTFFLVMALERIVPIPVVDRILGFAIALFIAANVRDVTPSGRLVTIALAPWAAFATTSLAALLLHDRIAAAAMVPVIMFAAAYGGLRGPRYGSLGLVALIAYIISLVTRQPPDTLPMRLVVLLLAAGDVALVRVLLLPERPTVELARLNHAIATGINGVLDRIAAAVAAGNWTHAERANLRQAVLRLGDVITLAQVRLAAPDAQVRDPGNDWLRLLRIGLGIERVARAALDDLGEPGEQAALLEALHILRTGNGQPLPPSTGRLAAALALLGHATRDQTPEPMAFPPPNAAPGPQPPDLRPAIQTAIAAGLATVCGELVSPNRWYWAAFAAFVMFQGTRSRGESIAKGLQFMAGTLAGVVAGMLLATVLSGHDDLSMVAIVIAVFLAFQANAAAYGMMTFWITIILGLLFGMLGYFTPDVLLLRLKETALGAVCGVLVASLFLVRRERAATNRATVAFLNSLGRLVDQAAAAVVGDRIGTDVGPSIAATEQSFRDLAATVRAERSASLASRLGPLQRRMLLLEACGFWAREFGQISLRAPPAGDEAMAGYIRIMAARIDTRLQALIAYLGDGATAPASPGSALEALSAAPYQGLADRTLRLLIRIDGTLERLEAGWREGAGHAHGSIPS